MSDDVEQAGGPTNAWATPTAKGSSGGSAAGAEVETIELTRKSMRTKFGVTFSEFGSDTSHAVTAVKGSATGQLFPGDKGRHIC